MAPWASKLLAAGLILGLSVAGCSSSSDSAGLKDAGPDGGSGNDDKTGGDGDGGLQGDATMTGQPGSDGSAADACASVSNPCFFAGISCNGTDLVTCAADDNGCMVQTSESCETADTNVCDSGASGGPACAYDPCAGLENACDTAGLSCDGIDLVDCAENSDGCLVAETTDCTTVGDNNSCDPEASGGPACVYDECKTDAGEAKESVCVLDATTCQADILVTCSDDAAGCPIATRVDCTMETDKNSCDDSSTPQCVFDPCKGVTECLTAGTTCRGTDLVVCAANGDGCLVETITDCTEGGSVAVTCDDSGDPVCSACSDDAACTGAGEGDRSCDGNVLETCTDLDGDMCLDLLREDCGDNFTCNSGNGCVYSGSDTCDEALAAGNVLSGSFTTAAYDTSAEGVTNDYSSFVCPTLPSGIPFGAGAPDLLFAVDVPPQSVTVVSFTGVSGFTGTGLWMLALPVCADGDLSAEEQCTGLSADKLRMANESDETVRYYIVVDADGDTNVGSFALEVDTRTLGCGDGKTDGSEECDDGNIFEGDGCTPSCTLEEGYACTGNDPSVCTRRPEENVCGNIQCDALPSGAPGGTVTCCTPDEQCGVSLQTYYGAGCFLRDQEGVADDSCPPAESTNFFLATLQGCCRPDNKCGIQSATGAGCIERSEAWLNHQDSDYYGFYPEPWESIDCTYP
ncbi:MAG: hypothetical protein OEZ06_05175 [Myxococcales bacterium]|nr:hypothetical protein [Myxococcales bacterium]